MQALFLLTFIVELIFGLGFIIAPGTLFGTFGVTPDAFGNTLARMFGSAQLAFCTLLWYARGKDNADLKKTAVRSMFVYWLVSTIFMVIAQLGGLFNPMGWSPIALHLVFLVWTGAFAFKK